jgi:NADPH:quinone reductase-like Zn-dependent oxidoreductase
MTVMRRRCSRVPDSVEASRSIPAAVGFDVVYHTVGGKVLDASFEAVRRFGHVVSALGWGTHALAPLSFRATYSGVLPCCRCCRAKAARVTGRS